VRLPATKRRSADASTADRARRRSYAFTSTTLLFGTDRFVYQWWSGCLGHCVDLSEHPGYACDGYFDGSGGQNCIECQEQCSRAYSECPERRACVEQCARPGQWDLSDYCS
jgi:hypothetical protein